MRRIVILALLTLTLAPGTARATHVELPLTPDPATCDADPIDIESLVARATTPVTALGTPVATPSATREASPEVLDQLLEVVVASIACTNANQPLRALSYFTEDFLLNRVGDEPDVTLGHLLAASGREAAVAAVEERVTIEAVDGATMSPGRAGLVVVTSGGGERSTAELRLADVDGSWKIDEVLS